MTQLNPVLSPELSTFEGIRHGFFTREGGVSSGIFRGLNAGLGSGDAAEDVIENRRRITQHLGVAEDRLASPYQVHSNLALIARDVLATPRPQVDGLVTDQPGLALGVVTADCGPVLFADASAGVIGAAHAGWKGALTGVLENTIEQMETLGAKRSAITAVLGPCISSKNYEVGPEFPRPFLDQDKANSAYFSPSGKPGHFMFDLAGYIHHRLTSAGVQAAVTGQCTYAQEDDFFSYRRTTHRQEPDYGRQISTIVLV